MRALDYLLKPFTRERFEDAMVRAKEQLAAEGGRGRRRRLLELLAGAPRRPKGSCVASSSKRATAMPW